MAIKGTRSRRLMEWRLDQGLKSLFRSRVSRTRSTGSLEICCQGNLQKFSLEIDCQENVDLTLENQMKDDGGLGELLS